MDDKLAKKFTYKKKPGTSGVGGQLYETKLLSLVLFRALKDEDFGEFYLGSNIRTGSFDDVCIKFKRNERDTVVFIQMKHKEDINKPSDFNLVDYFESYKEIKKSFSIKNEDVLFKSDAGDTDIFLVFYTASKSIIDKGCKIKINRSMSWLEKLICAGNNKGQIFQICDIDFLMKLQRDLMIDSLGDVLVENLVKNNDKCYANMLTWEHCNGLLRRYHVVLAEKVINVSIDVESNNSTKYRIGRFREEFFLSTDAVLRKLWKKILDKLDKREREEIKTNTFKLPHNFGNIDLTVRKDNRILALANSFKELFKKYNETKIITLDEMFCENNKEFLNKGFLSLNGGLESLVGNLLISDGETHMLKFSDELEPRHINATKLLTELKKYVDSYDIFSYRFDVQMSEFTALSLDGGRRDRVLGQEYLSTLWCYVEQANENEVGDTLTQEIEADTNYSINNPHYPTVQSEAIFIKFHHLVQKWWMKLNEVEYLDHTCKYYEKSKTEIVDICATFHSVYVSKIIDSCIQFWQDEALNLPFDDENRIIIIKTKNCFFTAIKIFQHFVTNKSDIIFLDIEYIIKRLTDCNSMLTALENSIHNMFVLIDKKQTINNDKNGDNLIFLEKVIKTLIKRRSKKLFIISERDLLDMDSLTGLSVINDENINLANIKNYVDILKKISVTFQNRATTMDRLIDDETKHLIQSDVLSKLLDNKVMKIGKSITVPHKYLEIKKYYTQRKLKREDTDFSVKHLRDINDNAVLVVGEPGMGKTILLNHLSDQTKDFEDDEARKCSWIIKLGLKFYYHEFLKWKINRVDISAAEALRFLCKHALACFKCTCKRMQRNKETFRIVIENDIPTVTDFKDHSFGLLEIHLFLSYFKKGNVILLLDGFDEICPTYEAEVIHFINALTFQQHEKGCLIATSSIDHDEMSLDSRICNCMFLEKANRLWITSRPYTSVQNFLIVSLGKKAFHLQNMTLDEQRNFSHSYFKANINENEYNQNIENFMKAIVEAPHTMEAAVSLALYVFAIEYFESFYKLNQGARDKLSHWQTIINSLTELWVPRLLHIAIQNFVDRLTSNSSFMKWDLEIESRILENLCKKHRD